MHSKTWDETTLAYSNFNGTIVEISEWISKFIHPTLYRARNYLSMLKLKIIQISKRCSMSSAAASLILYEKILTANSIPVKRNDRIW